MLPVLVPTSMIVTVVLSSIFLMKKNDVLVSNIFTGTNVKTQLGYCRMQYISYESIRQESLSFYCFTVNDLFLKLTQTSIFLYILDSTHLADHGMVGLFEFARSKISKQGEKKREVSKYSRKPYLQSLRSSSFPSLQLYILSREGSRDIMSQFHPPSEVYISSSSNKKLIESLREVKQYLRKKP